MSNIQATQSTKPTVNTVRDFLKKMAPEMEKALPKHMRIERLNRIALTSIQKNITLQKCEPLTLVGAIVQAAQLGLEPDPIAGEAYLVPFFNGRKQRFEVQLIPGYKGLIKLIYNSDRISWLKADVVHEGDKFAFEYGSHAALMHVPARRPADRGDIFAAYSLARMSDGSISFEVMYIDELEAIKKRSKSKDKSGNIVGPWVTDPEMMYRKTVIKRHSKVLPFSFEIQRTISLDDAADTGKPQDLGSVIDVNETLTPDEGDVPAVEEKVNNVKKEELFNNESKK